ncbi:MAG: undecaprenyldiphospho-muramoylpentapeptide beta-N-acetylglucosaminyltransferase [Deltaproteobacteria bacterium]|nr:undecaprenyldiphospho-muramoylpentapeptide beta-N-acetylglucosaminyltransferase [Deltaproteobacteria bacterium]MBW2136573.1 undecaprenyldiphospho-muramoylpentapeptide beta-N-acetylglucosaminyltransferase [Deltaproteobacteria bacterium]
MKEVCRPIKGVRLIIAGGGTGGHLFPGIAVAEEVSRRFRDSEILFITGRRRMESRILSREGFRQSSIAIEGLKGRGWRGMLGTIMKLPKSFFQSVSIMKGFSPDVVLGVGGYSSGPVCLAARVMGIPSAIHEQNSFPGLTNRILCRIVDRVFISFEDSRRHFSGGRIFLTGNPVREELVGERAIDGEDQKGFTVLVVGGSQGARAVNSAFLAALEVLRARGRVPRVIHQTGEADYERVLKGYLELGVQGDVTPFIMDMGSAYRRADLVVSRAGATTISELAALGKPSILVPYPHAANRHQETNAQMLARVGGARVILEDGLSGEKLADLLTEYMSNREDLAEMGRLAKGVGRPDATRVIVDFLLEMTKE